MKGIKKVIDVITGCTLPGFMYYLEVDVDLYAWSMHLHNGDGIDYHLSQYHNGGYVLHAQATQALVTHNPQGMMITRDPEKDMCHIYIPKLTKRTFMDSMAELRTKLRGVGIDNNQREQ